MRLIDTNTLELIHTDTLGLYDLSDSQAEGYAILSHVWGAEEMSFNDYRKGRNVSGPGYDKIVRSCRLAHQRGIRWLWCDTCCIDKKSSSELTESINSMFKWYQQAIECYAYLEDVFIGPGDTPESCLELFRRSKWFSRGWTLQELVAPSRVLFLDMGWNVFGEKSLERGTGVLVDDDEADQSKMLLSRDVVLRELQSLTKIPAVILTGERYVGTASVAQRMSWAAGRTTTRVEDMAYCLMGIFDINMPLLYGEGKKAFRRLQMEIIRNTNDESLFYWHKMPGSNVGGGVLSTSCHEFKLCHEVQRQQLFARQPYAVTNQGLEFRVSGDSKSHLVRKVRGERPRIFVMLNCVESSKPVGEGTEIRILEFEQLSCGHYARVFGKLTQEAMDDWVTFGISSEQDEVYYLREFALYFSGNPGSHPQICGSLDLANDDRRADVSLCLATTPTSSTLFNVFFAQGSRPAQIESRTRLSEQEHRHLVGIGPSVTDLTFPRGRDLLSHALALHVPPALDRQCILHDGPPSLTSTRTQLHMLKSGSINFTESDTSIVPLLTTRCT